MFHKVAIIMGSDSDLPVAEKAVVELKKFDIPYEVFVLSAHRSPERAAKLAKHAREQGFGVVIAIAGMAAHLAGVIAGHTTLPVIGVPCKGGALDGLDALLATVQMPTGVPVATVALGGGGNAAILAAQILSLSDETLADKLAAHKREMDETLKQKEIKMKEILGGNHV